MLYGCAGEGRTVFMEKKTASAITLTLLLTSMLTMAFSIQPVKAIGTIYIRADGSIDPPSAPIQSDGDLYTLTCDIVTDSYLDGIIIERDNMTLDGNGHFVEGILADESVGIGLDGRSNITIKNLEVKAFQYGIQLANSSDCNISGNNITNNSLKGVSLYNSANNTFRNNMVNGSIANFEVEGDHMLAFFQDVDDSNMLDGKPLRYLINQENATIDNSTYSSIGYLALINSTNLVIEELKLENNTQGMLLAYTRNSQVINNNIRNNAIYGIKLVECTNITISGNNIVNNGLVASSWWWPRYGVCFESSNNNFLFGNNMSRNYSSVWLNSSSNNIILENDMTDSQHITGVRLGNSSFNTIQGNNLTNFVTIFFAFFVDSSSFNNISENKITAGITGIGFILRDSSYNNISENDMNQIRGLNLETSNFNIVLGNKVIAPDDDVYAFGIFLGDSSSNNRIIENSMEAKNGTNVWLSNSTGNMLFHNNFMACMRQAYDYSWDEQAIPPSVNVWDDGYPSGGNYWSDYTGIDQKSGSYQNETGSDGMGDTPYVIDLDNQDNYPLMNPWPSGWKLDFMAPSRHPIVDFAIYNGSLYAAADNKLYVKEGSSWNVIDAPTFVTSLEPYGDKLVVGGQGGLYCYDGTPFNLIFSVPTYIKVLGVYDNRLYAGTMLDNPPRLYYCNGSVDNPSDWYVDTDFSAILGFSGAFGSIDSFSVYDNVMYLSSAGKLYSFNGTDWSIAASYDDVYAFLDMQVYNGKLYLAARDQGWRKPMYLGGSGFSGRVIEFDGASWTTVLDHDYWIYSLGVYDDKLYAGTANKILTYNGTSWEVSFNATEGAYYAISMINYDSKIYAGMGNGCIFADPAPLKAEHETIVVPEFSSTTILAVFTAVTMLAAALTRKKRTKRFC
jgi:parallel beta-helix repeat protein